MVLACVLQGTTCTTNHGKWIVVVAAFWQGMGAVIPIQMGEMGALGVSLVFCLMFSTDLPMRASLPFANLAFARRCCGV